jgi:S-adenosylhomocysteine hydrolase
VVDDGGDHTALLAAAAPHTAITSSAVRRDHHVILRLRAGKSGGAPLPHGVGQRRQAKRYYDNKYGTASRMGRSEAHHQPGGGGQTVVVAGYGWCGKGVAMRPPHGRLGHVTESTLQGAGCHHERLPGDENGRRGPGWGMSSSPSPVQGVITPAHFA